MGPDLDRRVADIAANRRSGASELLVEMAAVLMDALAAGVDLKPLARQIIQAQPSMAPAWNLIGHALGATSDPAAFAHYVAQLTRAPRTVAHHAAALLLTDAEAGPLRLVTISFSGTVLLTLQTLAAEHQLQVASAEGQPALEGRRMAEQLAPHGILVTHYPDAGLGQALDDADAVLVGADAISPDGFLNKSGTRMLAAAAAQQGTPFYVCATRDKFLPSAIADRLTIRAEPPAEIWPTPPPGVTVRNRYFEITSLDLVTAVISDLGVLGAALVPDACVSPHEELLLNL
jgi:translation initiation factor eIF-2B subunit delta